MIGANVHPEPQDGSITYYVAYWVQENCPIPCCHQHKTISEAVACCVQGADGCVKAFTDGRERALTKQEYERFIRELLALCHDQRELLYQDDMTGALNGRAFREVLGRESRAFRAALWYENKRSRRYRLPLTVVYIDLDGFKRVNDTLGHSTGDEVLKIVASTMRSTFREVDSVARLHGDEFALLLPDTGDARVVLEKLRKALKDVMKQHQGSPGNAGIYDQRG